MDEIRKIRQIYVIIRKIQIFLKRLIQAKTTFKHIFTYSADCNDRDESWGTPFAL